PLCHDDEGLRPCRGGNEIGRHQNHFANRALENLSQLVDQQVLVGGQRQPLGWIVCHHAGIGPLQLQVILQHLTQKVGTGDGLHVAGRRGVTLHTSGLAAQLLQPGGGNCRQNLLNRVGGAAGPVAIEVGGNLADDGADGQHVQISKQDAFGGTEVFVADVAATDDGGLVIGGEGFVVHAPVGA